MKITIDTKEDSKEDIRKVIQLLSTLAREDEVKVNSESFSSEGSTAFASIFGEGEAKEERREVKEERAGDGPIDFSGFMNLVENSEKKGQVRREIPRVVSY